MPVREEIFLKFHVIERAEYQLLRDRWYKLWVLSTVCFCIIVYFTFTKYTE